MMSEDLDAVVPFEEYKVDINVLGLRSLSSPGLLPVKKAYIRFLSPYLPNNIFMIAGELEED